MRLEPPFIRRRHTRRIPAVDSKNSGVLSNFDRWSLRAAQAATVLGVLTAIFGYFYSVRPIYQKALLDEAIAKKELELRAVTNALEESYKQVRKYTLRNFTMHSSAQCGGIIGAQSAIDARWSRGEKERSAEDEVLAIDVAKCMQEELKVFQSQLSRLRIADLAKLNSTISSRVSFLNTQQNEFLKKIRALPVLAAKNPSLLLPPGEFERKALEFIRRAEESGVVKKSSPAVQFKRDVERTQHSLAREFEKVIRSEILSIAESDWD